MPTCPPPRAARRSPVRPAHLSLLLLLIGLLLAARRSGAPTAAAAAPPARSDGTWVTECLHCRVFDPPSSRSLVAFDNRRLSVYGGDMLYLAVTDLTGIDQGVEVVDDAPHVGAGAAATVAGSALHISYYDAFNRDLRYATRPDALSGAFTIETIDSAGDAGRFSAIAVDSAGVVSVAYYDGSKGNLKLARRVGGTWQIETVDAEGDSGHHVAIVADPIGRLHIAYQEANDSRVRYALRLANGTWRLEAPDPAAKSTGQLSIVVESSSPRIAYHDAENTALKLAARNAGIWSNETLLVTGDVGDLPSLAVGPNGTLYASAWDHSNNRLLIGRRVAGVWTFDSEQLSDGYAIEPLYTSVVPKAGLPGPHVAVYVRAPGGERQLLHIVRIDERPTERSNLIVQDSTRLSAAALAIDANGTLHAAYRARALFGTAERGPLFYAVGTPGNWHIEAVVRQADRSGNIELALDGAGRPHIGLLDYLRSGVPFALHLFHDGTQWVRTTGTALIQSAPARTGSALAVAANGQAHLLSYRNEGSGATLYRERFNPTVAPQALASGLSAARCERPPLALDSAGFAHLVHCDQAGVFYRFQNAGGSFNGVLLGNPPDQNNTASDLAIDPTGRAHIGVATDVAVLRLQLEGSSLVSFVPVAARSFVGLDHVRVARDLSDNATTHVTFQDSGTAEVFYARVGAGAVQVQRVADLAGGVPLPEIALSPQNLPRIVLSAPPGVLLAVFEPAPPNPVPAVTSIAPTRISTSTFSFTLTVNGSGFVPGSRIQVNGVDLTTTFNSSTKLTARLNRTTLPAASSYTVRVVSPPPGGGTSNGLTIRVGLTFIGTTVAQPADGDVLAGVPQMVTLTWTHPDSNWRTLDTLDYLVTDGDATALWLRLQERAGAASELILFDAAGNEVGRGRGGEYRVLGTAWASVDLARTQLAGSGTGADDRSMTLTLALTFHPRAATVADGYNQLVELRNDAGEVQDYEAVGTWRVRPAWPVYVPVLRQ